MEEALKLMKAYFDPYIMTKLENWKRCEGYFSIVECEKGAIIKNPGSREEYLRFIIEGAGVVLSGPREKINCIDISLQHDFLSDFASVFSKEPTPHYVECIKAVKLAVISKERVFETYQSSFLGGALGRILSERQNMKKEMRRLLNTGTTHERYQRLLTEHGELLQEVGQVYLASYMGMSVQSFRRARNFRAGRRGLYQNVLV